MSHLAQMIAKRVQAQSLSALHKIGLHPRAVAGVFGGAKLSASEAADLELMRADNSAAPNPFRASPIWESLARRFDVWFSFEGIRDVESQEMNEFFSSPFPGNPKLLRYACWMLYNDIKARDKYNVLATVASTSSDPDSGLCFEFDGKMFSWDFLISVDSFYSIAEVDPRIVTDEVVVGELGAGWGRIGHILKSVNSRLTYAVFDLPEVLLVSSVYLPRRLPGMQVLSYRESRNMSVIGRAQLAGKDLAFFGAHDLQRCADGLFDFFINIASFQEMSKAQVGAYFDIIDRKLKGTLYTQQLWNSKTHAYEVGEISGYDDYPFPAHWSKNYVRCTTWSDLYFEAAFKRD